MEASAMQATPPHSNKRWVSAPVLAGDDQSSVRNADFLMPVTPEVVGFAAGDLRRSETPLTCSSSSSRVSSDADPSSSCPPSVDFRSLERWRTPVGEVYDSFAPGPEDLNLAPRPAKKALCFGRGAVWGSLGNSGVSRVLKFDDEDRAEDGPTGYLEEGTFLDHIYDDLLNAIVLKQVEDYAMNSGCFSGPRTPKYTQKRIDDIWETCPVAPMKPRSKRVVPSEKLSSSRRKLEF